MQIGLQLAAFLLRINQMPSSFRGNHSLGQPSGAVSNLFSSACRQHAQGNLMDAQSGYQKILMLNPSHFGALHLLGVTQIQTGQVHKAVEFISRALEIEPNRAEARCNLAIALRQLNRIPEALENLNKALKLNSKYPDAYCNKGMILSELKQYEDAVAHYKKAIALKPDFFEAYFNLANLLKRLGKFSEAIENYTKCIGFRGASFPAYLNLGTCYSDAKSYCLAIDALDIAIKLNPQSFEAFSNRGLVHTETGNYENALSDFERSLRLNASFFPSHYNQGRLLLLIERSSEALNSFDKAIELEPDNAEAYSNRGIALKALNRLDEALASYDKAIALNPNYAEAYCNRGIALNELNRLDEALASYDRAIALSPNYAFLAGKILLAKLKMCSWGDFNSDVDRLSSDISAGLGVTDPFPVLAFSNSRSLQLRAAQTYVRSRNSANQERVVFQPQTNSNQITIGYFSADFYDHATAHLMAEIFEKHSRDRFRLIAYSFGSDNKDQMRERIKSSFDQFHDVTFMSDEQVAELSRSENVDIAIDLKGYTRNSRTGIFASRAAPLQVNFLGFPGSLGADYYDYLIADRTLIPDTHQSDYAEKIVYLPHSYQPNDRQRKIADKPFTRKEFGLPEDAFVFCCFNNNYKITPPVFDVWMKLLRTVEKSVLWLFEGNKFCRESLRKEARQRSVDPDRLIFAKKLPPAEHLARHRCADLFLDTLPCNAHTTASDALWAGLPLLTQVGETFAGRVAASLLNAAGLPELITTSTKEYERTAIELAQNPARLDSIKRMLSDSRLTIPLFDSELYKKHLEAAYVAIYERYQAGFMPAHIYVNP